MSLSSKITQNKGLVWCFSFIVILGIFFRVYHFSDWLHFEIDQTYDTLIVSNAVENGISNLPLLGPTAGGGRALRLGPAFYYLEYLSGKIFGNSPPGYAALILVFSILSLPLFYLFLREYFSSNISLGLLAVYSVSFYSILYSRFSWSPNALPFLILAVFYCLLKCISPSEKKKEFWFLAMVSLAVVTSQIHFNAFFAIPAVVAVFLIIKRPRFRLRVWLGALAIVLFLYSPMITSDIKTGGQNFHFFLEKFKGGSGNRPVSLGAFLWEDFQYNALEYFLITSGEDYVNGHHASGYGLELQNENDSSWHIFGYLLFLAALIALIKNILTEKEERKKNFLVLCFLWFLFSFVVYFSVMKDGLYLYPRFFLLVSSLAIIFLGFILEHLRPERNRFRLSAFSSIIILLLFINISKTKGYFNQLKQANSSFEEISTEDVLPNTARVTLAQEYAITDYIESIVGSNSYPVYIKSKHEFEPVFWYFLEHRGIHYYDDMSPKAIYKEGNYFVIIANINNEGKFLEEYLEKYDIIAQKEFGSLTLYRLTPKPEAITALRQSESSRKNRIEVSQVSRLYTWKNLLSGKTNDKPGSLFDESIPAALESN